MSVPSPNSDPSKNAFLAGLPDKDRQTLQPHLQLVSLKLRDVLHMHGASDGHLHFPLTASVSLITTVKDGKGVEVALIGWEGLVGIWNALGSDTNWHEAVVQIPGHALKIKSEAFRDQLQQSRALLDRLHMYTRFVLAQISQTAVCNRLHRLDQRLARWLLMTHDQARTTAFPATHEFLSHMLGTERSDVTIAAGLLRSSGLITYSRGKINILDRKELERAACECYGILASELAEFSRAKPGPES